MRRGWLATVLLVTACAGGQTGEITELGACREPLGAVDLDAASEAGAPASEQLARLTTSAEGPLTWADADRPATQVTVAFAATGDAATLVGGEGCERPFLHVPVTVTLRTADGSLDEAIDAAVALQDLDGATVRGEAPLDALEGALEAPGMDPARASLVVHLESRDGSLEGQLFLHSGDDAEDQLPLASF